MVDRYRLEGAGPPVVLLNGLFQRLEAWEGLLPHLQGFQVLRYDMRGQGPSPVGEEALTPGRHARDLEALLDRLGLDRVHLVGLSNGGVVAQVFALERPERVRSLVLLCTTPRLDPALRAKVEAWLHALEAGGPLLRLRVALAWTFGRGFLNRNPGLLSEEGLRALLAQAPPGENQRRLLQGFLTLEDLRPRLRRLSLRALVVAGEEDLLFPLPYARELAEALGAELALLPLGHAAPVEDPDRVGQLVRALLEVRDAV
jgi:3-oxoadipate enol-lactonase